MHARDHNKKPTENNFTQQKILLWLIFPCRLWKTHKCDENYIESVVNRLSSSRSPSECPAGDNTLTRTYIYRDVIYPFCYNVHTYCVAYIICIITIHIIIYNRPRAHAHTLPKYCSQSSVLYIIFMFISGEITTTLHRRWRTIILLFSPSL